MTYEAQFALRRVIEKYSITTRFCLICNYLNKIIPAIRSRCMIFRFSPISDKYKFKVIKNIAKKENIELNNDVIESIVDISEGDLRKSINILQTLSLYSKQNLDQNICYEFCGIASFNEIERCIEMFLNKDFDLALLMDREFKKFLE